MLRLTRAVLLLASCLLLFVSVWVLVPPPHELLFPLAVGAPELSPPLLAVSFAICVLSACQARHRGDARLSLVFAATASLLLLVPIAQLPGTLGRFNRAMAGVPAQLPAEQPGEVRVTRRVPFSKADGVPLYLDVYQPPSNGKYPVLMQIYGGSWQSGAPANQEWFARHFASRGYLVVAIDYRHAPEWKWPEQIVDARTALYWVTEEADSFGGDSSRIVIVGRSAGAQLAMRLAYQEGPSSIRGVVNYYGPVDLAEGWRNPPRPDPANVRGLLEAFIGGTPTQKPEHYKHASPLTWVSPAVAPTLSIYGSRDHLVESRFGRMLDATLRKSGVTSVLLELPWSEHAFDAVPNGMGRYISLRYTERFVAWAVTR